MTPPTPNPLAILAPPPSPFLPGTNIQLKDLANIAAQLMLKATFNGECMECHLERGAEQI